MGNDEVFLGINKLTKNFPDVKALSDVDFTVKKARSMPWSEKMVQENPHLLKSLVVSTGQTAETYFLMVKKLILPIRARPR